MLALGKSALVLVPEIALTPQTVEHFRARFIGQKVGVAVLHSHLSSGERHDQWQHIRSGRARIVIGARSAVFAPLDNLGIIVVDEEHEHSYKQEESPHYHARDVAVMRGHLERVTVVLGSATPSLESYHHAKEGKYRLVELLQRVEEGQMPVTHVLDIRSHKERRAAGARSRRAWSRPSRRASTATSRRSSSSIAAATPPRCNVRNAATSRCARIAASR